MTSGALDYAIVKPLSKEQLDAINGMAEWQNMRPGNVINGRNEDRIRKCNVAFAPQDHWTFDLCLLAAKAANKAFMMDGLRWDVEGIGLTEYPVDGHYVWHIDRGAEMHSFASRRRLSITIQLSDPRDYDGGILQLMWGATEVRDMPMTQGLVIVFPAYTMHRVTPVTRGTRRSLVTWIR